MIYKYDGDVDFENIIIQLKKDQQRKVRTKNVNILDYYQNKYWNLYKNDQLRLRWSTKANMTCGFTVSHQLIDFTKVKSLVDVGCGTGNYFQDVLSKYQFDKVVGIDAVPNFIDSAKEKTKQYNNVEYITSNIFDIKNLNIGEFDLCTFNGVFQTLDLDSISDVFDVLNDLVKSDGQIWITALNYYKSYHWSPDNRRFVGLWKYKPEEFFYYMKDFKDIRYGFYNPDSILVEDKTKADFVFVHGIKK